MLQEYSKNFLIYYNNLSTYYIVCVCLSLTAVIFSWLFHFKNVKVKTENAELTTDKGSLNVYPESSTTENEDLENIILSFKSARKHTIDTMTAALTEEQLEEEKNAEREQLAAILDLLKQQEDKFQVGTMEELEGQLKLYR